MDSVLDLKISSYRDEAGYGAYQNADAQENREDLVEVVYVISEQAHLAEYRSDFRVNPNDNRIKNNHRYQSEKNPYIAPSTINVPAGKPIAGADQSHHFYLLAGRIDVPDGWC